MPKVHREFSMGVASAADTSGILVAAVLAQVVHTSICEHYIGFAKWVDGGYAYDINFCVFYMTSLCVCVCFLKPAQWI